MRRFATTAIATAVLAIALDAPASADESVTATNFQFNPQSVTIGVMESVTWTNGGGLHNVKFDDGSFEEPAEPSFTLWTVSRRFDVPGTFRYYCEAHGGPSGSGMAGTVVVQGGQPSPGGDTTVPRVDGLRVVPRRLCNRRTRRCPRVGGIIRFTLSEAADVEIVITATRGDEVESKTIRKRDRPAGANSIRYSFRGLPRGPYRAALTARDDANNASPTETAGLRIASSR
jgi:plastocyanin